VRDLILGILVGAGLSLAYVRYELELPPALQLTERLKGNIVSAATEGALYDIDGDAKARERAFEVFLANRARDAVEADRDAGHPLMKALHDRRAVREARQLAGAWSGYGEVLAKPALREALVRRHGAGDDEMLKRRMLAEALDGKPFLKLWLAKSGRPMTPERLREVLLEVARLPVKR
jgi:hypothetical protein